MRHLNYNHLLYFWIVGREGSIARAAEVLHLTPQTISGQLKLLDQVVGERLFKRNGRRLVLTETGQMVFRYADEIFRLGTELTDVLSGRTPGGQRLFSVGVSDVLPKTAAYRILEPALKLAEPVRIVCQEGKLDALLSDLSLHKLDLVLSDSPASPTLGIRVFNHPLGDSGVTFFATPETANALVPGFPRSLHGTPMLLPTAGTALRRGIEQWFDQQDIHPVIAGEFDDSALLKAFGESGGGVFPAPSVVGDEVLRQYRVASVGYTSAVREHFYAISAERRLKHPAVVAISEAARRTLFESQ